MNIGVQQRGFILPTLTSVTVILLILATALLASGTSSLRASTHNQQSDQALFAAEAGLVRATAEYAKAGSLSSPFKQDLENSSCRYEVTITENKNGADPNVPGGPEIPEKTVYFLSRGYSENGTYRETAALFRYGMEAFQVGALGDQIEITDSTFDAYDSSKGEYNPDAPENELPLLATNTGTGTPITLKGSSDIKGDLFVGKGGGTAQVDKGTSTLGSIHPLTEPIELEKVEVPEDESSGSGHWDIPPVGNLELVDVDDDGIFYFDDGLGLKFSVDPSLIKPDDPNSSLHNAIRAGPGVTDSGGKTNSDPSDTGFQIQISLANNHALFLNRDGATGVTSAFYSHPSQSTNQPSPSPEATTIANFIYSGGGGGGGSNKNLTNVSSIQPGHYDSITMNDGGTSGKLAKSGIYVVKNLNISPGNSIALDNPDLDVTIYVTESMSVDGKDTIVNSTRRAPKMKIYYTGTNDINLQGGSQSYYSLIAKDAKVSLRSLDQGVKSHFYGALVGKTVSVTNAMFHFDVDTKGIGTGTRGTGILLMNRHRL